MQEASMKVNGMSCRSCINKIESSLDMMGVEGKVHFDQGTVQVKYDDSKVNLVEIKEVIRSKGYDVEN
ncbi:heavy metal-associated domain-containing protein [Paenibacillus sp.]|jgi:copper chaperone CopZ|uniref:heavy-metal-associated domain-containing protein n=1 Tax=Paenibacillus sp. TaxID=58172 RepID=UPI00282E825F|nr:heavy metal-associated domain-containing protein [Paenibacillus sp.]MDR0266615.1 cation transporter [Paenibacillus sp.]